MPYSVSQDIPRVSGMYSVKNLLRSGKKANLERKKERKKVHRIGLCPQRVIVKGAIHLNLVKKSFFCDISIKTKRIYLKNKFRLFCVDIFIRFLVVLYAKICRQLINIHNFDFLGL